MIVFCNLESGNEIFDLVGHSHEMEADHVRFALNIWYIQGDVFISERIMVLNESFSVKNHLLLC